MMPILQIGSFSLPLPSLIIIIGIWLGFTLSEHRASHYGINKNQLGNLLLLALVTGLIGARLAYVIRYPSAFYSNPLDIFSRNPGLLDTYGGILIAGITFLIYIQRKSLPLLSTLDSLTPALAVMGVALGLSHLASGDFFGSPTNLPWAIELWGEARHPTQIYEIISAIIIFLIIIQSKLVLKSYIPGTVFLIFIAFSATAHIFIAAFRGDVGSIAMGLRRDQFFAWIILAIALSSMGKLLYTDFDNQRRSAKLIKSTNPRKHN